MNMKSQLNNKITILVNSCDDYEDLWKPFFSLLKKYWEPENIRIVLNTESKNFCFEDLSIDCIHPSDIGDQYGKRMINVLSQIKTPYVITLLDDFFMRKKVDWNLICDIIGWMDKDKHIAYFNCDCTKTFYDYELNYYPGYKRLPNGNEYTLNMQAAVWRTKKLQSYWRPDISPWEWEMYTNLIAARNKNDKFYCITDPKYAFCDYGFCFEGMGVYRGKWVEHDVVPLFKKEKIEVDFSERGFYIPVEKISSSNQARRIELRDTLKATRPYSQMIHRCLGEREIKHFKRFLHKNQFLRLVRDPADILYIHYSLASQQNKFLIKIGRIQRIKSVLNKVLLCRKSR